MLHLERSRPARALAFQGCSVERDETGQNGGSQSVQRERFTGEIDDEEAKELLRRDVFAAEDAVPRLIHVPLTDGQFDAVIPWGC
jgi:hypothetical protein